jgi:anti-sigma regulatory factor (Ser/Thr protein kinase)
VLPLRNGNEYHNPSYSFPLTDFSQVGEARRFALILCSDVDLDEIETGRVSIIVTELGNNLIRYAKNASLILRKISRQNLRGIEILSVDCGPGLDPKIVMEDGFTTGTTPGTGLGSIKRQSDVFDIYSSHETGTVIVSRVFSKHSEPKSAIEVGAINLPIKGELLCGDAWCIHETETGFRALVADGLGHGPEANQAAIEAVHIFSHNLKADTTHLLNLVHERLRRTRGAAIFLLSATDGNIEFAGAGNIRSVVLNAHETKTLISQNGTAGIQMATVRPLTENWNGSGYVVLHSDGIHSRWSLSEYPGLYGKHPSIIAAVINRDCSRNTDDSTIVVIRRSV